MTVVSDSFPPVARITTFDGDAPSQPDLQRLGRLQYVVVERFDLNRSRALSTAGILSLPFSGEKSSSSAAGLPKPSTV